ncbi:MAG: peptide deformylase [Bacteroidales bacterium]|nr:peptide deformylase [Bacteroidales bacterium]
MQSTHIVFIFLFVSRFALMASAPFIVTAPFTEREREIIYSGDRDTSFRVLLVTDPVDSLVLRMRSSDVDPHSIAGDESLQLLIQRLNVTMSEEGGIGIAAPQVGVLKNVFLLVRTDLPGQPTRAIINPKIVNSPEETVCFEGDGCLSIPDIRGNSLRFAWIDVEYWDEQGYLHREHLKGYSRTDHFPAVIFQHEYDHLQGVLFTDKICTTIGQ